ncbi:MAG TPA: HDOD domain-containing protein, partial [Candidatus Hydrogenedentes bacterium]|nr:HDOD domain-containing protein [Candidatus Hydrogenedentota bacterium]
MGKSELRHLIAGIDHLPATMKVVGRALSVLFDASPDLEAAGALFAIDPALASCALRMANVPGANRASSETILLRDAVQAVGYEGLRRAVLGVTLTSLPVQSCQQHLERLQRHALACATCAAKTAAHTRVVSPGEAYVAGLLHDVGRLALIAAMPDEYCAFLENNEPAELDRLERAAFDVDHALVGKWMAERWTLPRHLSQAIWFHHLPPGTLLGDRPIVHLVAIVGFANAMSAWIVDGGDKPSPAHLHDLRAHAARLGLEHADIESLHEQTRDAMSQRLVLLESGAAGCAAAFKDLQKAASNVTLPGRTESAESLSLKKEIKWLQALNRLNTSLRPSQSLSEVLTLIVATVREGLDAAPGMCCAFDEGNRHLVGMTWDKPDAPPQQFRIPLSPSTQQELDEVELLALEALDELGIGMSENGWRGAERTEPVLHDGILMLPMVADGTTRGQIMFETESQKIENHSWDAFKLMAFAGACGAVLARHHAYGELRELSEDLADAIARNAGALSAGDEDSLAEFAIGASHALQRPLNIVASQAQQLLRRMRSPEETSAVESILEQNRALTKLVNDLMAFARPGLSVPVPTVVNYVLHRLVTTVSDRLEAKGITIAEEYEEGLPRVGVDKHQLEQALLNLIVNGEQAMSQTGGQLLLKTSANSDRSRVHIMVQDSGPGVSAKHAESIFEPFVSLREGLSGTGLGLAVCRAVVRKHGGEIRLLNPDMAGAAFEITLPVEREPAAEAPASAPDVSIGRAEKVAPLEIKAPVAARPSTKPAKASGNPPSPKPYGTKASPFEEPGAPPLPSLLLIDENETTREVLKETLRNRGFSVIAAQNAVRAMQAIAATLFDAVLLDFELRDVHGPNMLTEIHNIRPGVPVIVMTADTNPRTAQSALER